MTITGVTQNWAWIVVLITATIIGVLTFLKIKGKVSFRIGLSLVRGVIFLVLFCIPLFEQPKISSIIALTIVGIVFLTFGIILTVVASRQLMRTDLQGIKGIPEELITSGPYSVIRHPINLGLIFTFAGWYIIWRGVYSLYFLAVLIIVFIIETFWEERSLEKALGDRYKKYKQKVRMFFPRLKNR